MTWLGYGNRWPGQACRSAPGFAHYLTALPMRGRRGPWAKGNFTCLILSLILSLSVTCSEAANSGTSFVCQAPLGLLLIVRNCSLSDRKIISCFWYGKASHSSGIIQAHFRCHKKVKVKQEKKVLTLGVVQYLWEQAHVGWQWLRKYTLNTCMIRKHRAPN